jgi:hypothetical protein
MKRTISSLIALVLSIISQCAIASTPVEAPVPQAVVSECRQRNQHGDLQLGGRTSGNGRSRSIPERPPNAKAVD